MSARVPTADPQSMSPFEQVRNEAHRWILLEAYNGRKGYDGDFESHEMWVRAPKRSRVDDLTPLLLPSLLAPTGDPFRAETTGPTTPIRGRTARLVGWPLVGVAASSVVVFAHPMADLLALSLGAAGLLAARALGVGQPRNATGTGLHPPKPLPRLPKDTYQRYAVVPEIAYVYRMLASAPQRLLDLRAETNAIAACERAYEVVLREVPRLPEEPWVLLRTGSATSRYINGQNRSVSYQRIMETGAEALVILRAAEEKEYALAPQSTKTGPWSQLSMEPVVVEMLEMARMAQDLSGRLA